MTTDTADRVEAARRGDLSAFDELVIAHQDAAFAYALALTRNRAAAQDAVQDAFLDAYLRLPQLREGGAFRAWLRRIVFKHCDRQRRRRRSIPDMPNRTAEAADEAYASREARERMFEVIEELPEHERFVVALHYLGDQSVQAIAEFLALTPSAVKKRLFSARKRLRDLEETMAAAPARPFALRIQLFLAIRAGDRELVARILSDCPELLEGSERWSDEEALAGGFTLAHEQTPLILAAGLGDEALVELLLDVGAEPDGRCGCDNAETALWSAARAGHHQVVGQLLRAGADPNATNRAGFDVARLARWRSDEALAEAFGCRLSSPSGKPWVFVDPQRDLLQTGIKALDLWAPLNDGAVVRVHGAAETGLTVLLAEISSAVGAAGGKTVWTSWQRHAWERRELEALAARAAVERDVEVLMSSPGSHRGRLLPEAMERLRALRTVHPVVAHIIFEQEGHASEVEAMASGLRGEATVTLVVRPWRLVTRGTIEAPEAPAPFDATIVTDQRLAEQGLYPAIDPFRTRSGEPDGELAGRARALMADYAALGSDLARESVEGVSGRECTIIARAQRLLAFLTQPFFTATPDTGWAGTRFGRAEWERELKALLDGAQDAVEPAALRYQSSGPEG